MLDLSQLFPCIKGQVEKSYLLPVFRELTQSSGQLMVVLQTNFLQVWLCHHFTTQMFK